MPLYETVSLPAITRPRPLYAQNFAQYSIIPSKYSAIVLFLILVSSLLFHNNSPSVSVYVTLSTLRWLYNLPFFSN